MFSEFSLLDRNRFSKTKKIEQGQCVYLETATNHYWYFDNLHKDHYEVFNRNKEHIGAANLQGEINRDNNVSGRTIDI
jgi:hypothetical protein